MLVAWTAAALAGACGAAGAPSPVSAPGAGERGKRSEALVALRAPDAARLVAVERASAEGGSRIILMKEDGERFTALTEPEPSRSLDVTPAWSPDGLYIAFSSSRGSDRPDRFAIWALYLGTEDAEPVRLTDGRAVDSSPAWSPDGRHLLFASSRGGAGQDLYRLEVLRDPDGTPRPGALARITSDPGHEFEPAWSPDGRLIAYVAQLEGSEATFLRLARPDGSEARDLTGGPSDRSPDFHPGGRGIVFSARAPARDDHDLWVVGLDGKGRRRLVDEASGDERFPRWDAEGRRVFAASLLRGEDGRVAFSTVVFVDVREPSPRLRALPGRPPLLRLGVDPAPVPLDGETLNRAPTSVVLPFEE